MRSFFILSLGITIALAGCLKTSMSPTNRLPPATSAGDNTMGCLVNGSVFVPDKNALSSAPYYGALYEYLYPYETFLFPDSIFSNSIVVDRDKCFRFRLFGSELLPGGGQATLTFYLDSVNLQQGQTYTLAGGENTGVATLGGSHWATYQTFGSYGSRNYQTTSTVTGQITITYMTAIEGGFSVPSGPGILSGTFQLNAINVPGDTVHITKGRFDMTPSLGFQTFN